MINNLSKHINTNHSPVKPKIFKHRNINDRSRWKSWSRLGKAHKCGGIKPVSGITLSSKALYNHFKKEKTIYHRNCQHTVIKIS